MSDAANKVTQLADTAPATERAVAGLQRYTIANIPDLARGAREGYDVSRAALRHFVDAIAALDEGSIVLEADSKEYAAGKLEERKAPEARAFEVRDRIAGLLDSVPRPDGVTVKLERIQRYRASEVVAGKKELCPPVTVVAVRVVAHVVADRLVLFLADTEGT